MSIVVPILNEEATLETFLATVVPIIEGLDLEGYEILFIDDGSTDQSVARLEDFRREYPAIRVVSLSRNFGKEAALTAGLEWCRGDAVIPMDVDLQDPPELITDFVRLWREGFDIVFGKREERRADSAAKRWTAGRFYKFFNAIADRPIEENAGDFRLMSRRVVEATLQLRERNRFMKGIFAWVGFSQTSVLYQRPERSAGTTKFNYWKLWTLALDGITGYSTVPLKIWTYVGVFFGFCAFVYTAILVGTTIIFGRDVPGYASTLVAILVLGGVQLISLGVIGEYLSRLYIESKQRPIYLVQKAVGFNEDAPKPAHRRISVGLTPPHRRGEMLSTDL